MTALREDDRRLRFLLGDLPPEERDAVEAEYFGRDESFEELQGLEEELLEAYCEGTLPAALRPRFEAAYLGTPGRRRHLALTRSLMRLGQARRARAARPAWGLRRTWAAGLAAALLLGLAIPLVRAVTRNHQLEAERETLHRELLDRSGRVREQGTRIEELSEELARAQAEQDRLTTLLSEAARAGRVLSLVLRSGMLRGGGQVPSLVLRPGIDVVRLVLPVVPATGPLRYRAALQDVEGRELSSRSGLLVQPTPSGPAVVLTLDPRSLAPGHLVVALSGTAPDGRTVQAGEYVFQVARR